MTNSHSQSNRPASHRPITNYYLLFTVHHPPTRTAPFHHRTAAGAFAPAGHTTPTTSIRGRSPFTPYRRASPRTVRTSARFFQCRTESSGRMYSSLVRVRTSTNTRPSPSIPIKSISPRHCRRFRETILIPCFLKYRAAAASPRSASGTSRTPTFLPTHSQNPTFFRPGAVRIPKSYRPPQNPSRKFPPPSFTIHYSPFTIFPHNKNVAAVIYTVIAVTSTTASVIGPDAIRGFSFSPWINAGTARPNAAASTITTVTAAPIVTVAIHRSRHASVKSATIAPLHNPSKIAVATSRINPPRVLPVVTASSIASVIDCTDTDSASVNISGINNATITARCTVVSNSAPSAAHVSPPVIFASNHGIRARNPRHADPCLYCSSRNPSRWKISSRF